MSSKLLPTVTKILCTLTLLLSFNGQAIEGSWQVHKGEQSESYGYSIGITDNFFQAKEYNWAISYNHLENIDVTWNTEAIDFSIDTVDLMLGYRYYPKSYNSFYKSLIFEFQAGVGIAVTENKFDWPDLGEEKYFSEQGDVNAVASFLIHKKIGRKASMHIGVKHYFDYAEFGDVSSIFIGFNYQFGKPSGY
ncbi:MAG: hypothetical protein OCD00_15165 [Colwellia sp.]